MEAAARWLAARLLRQRIHGALIHLSGSFTVANVGLRERVSQARGAGTEPQRRVDARRLGSPRRTAAGICCRSVVLNLQPVSRLSAAVTLTYGKDARLAGLLRQ